MEISLEIVLFIKFYLTLFLNNLRIIQNYRYGIKKSFIFFDGSLSQQIQNFIQSIGMTFEQFFANLNTINANQISRMQFFRVITLIHIETYNNFDPQQVFLELSRNKETILISDLKKIALVVAASLNEKRPGQQKLRQDEMKKKVIRIGLYKLQQFVVRHSNPLEFFRQFDSDGNSSINKTQFNKILVATDIKQFGSRQIRKMVIDHVFKYFPKGQLTFPQICAFFKISYKKHQPRSVSPLKKQQENNKSFPKMNPHVDYPLNNKGHSPFNNPIFNEIDPYRNPNQPKKSSPLKVPINNNIGIRAPSPNKPNQFHKKKDIPIVKPTIPQIPNFQKKDDPKDDLQNRISNCDKCYPLSMKYYRLGNPQPYEYQVLEQFEDLLNRNGKYIDKQNPKISEGSYVSASNIFKVQYHIFQMAASVLLRERSRIGIAQQIQPKDIIQGSVGDCYLLSSIASIISLYPQLIAERFLINTNPSNFYAVKLFIDGQWKVITTDDQFPCKGNSPIFAKPHTNQIWVMLLQKCWAKVFGSYKAIEAGSSKEGFLALTGAPCEVISQQKEEGQQQAIKQIQIAQRHRYVATMSGSNYLQSLGKKGEEQLGLITGHAYSLMKVVNANGQTLVKLRNPWGRTTWKGDWSFGSQKWTKQLRDRYNYNKNPEDGSFYMNWKDFRKYFGEIVICKLNPTFVHDSIRSKTSKKKSGYFQLKVTTAGQYIISIYQVNKRKMSQKYSNYEYSQSRLIVLKKQGNKMRYIGSKSTSQYQVCSVDLQLQEGEYIISAKVFWKYWDSSQMVLTSYGTDHVSLNLVNRSIAPVFKQYMIKTYSNMFAGTGKIKNYQKYGFNATCETNFSLQTGLGYVRMVNKSDKGYESIQEMQIKGLKLIKPDRFPLQFVMAPKSEKVYGFFVTPSGFEYSNTQKIKY